MHFPLNEIKLDSEYNKLSKLESNITEGNTIWREILPLILGSYSYICLPLQPNGWSVVKHIYIHSFIHPIDFSLLTILRSVMYQECEDFKTIGLLFWCMEQPLVSRLRVSILSLIFLF